MKSVLNLHSCISICSVSRSHLRLRVLLPISRRWVGSSSGTFDTLVQDEGPLSVYWQRQPASGYRVAVKKLITAGASATPYMRSIPVCRSGPLRPRPRPRSTLLALPWLLTWDHSHLDCTSAMQTAAVDAGCPDRQHCPGHLERVYSGRHRVAHSMYDPFPARCHAHGRPVASAGAPACSAARSCDWERQQQLA